MLRKIMRLLLYFVQILSVCVAKVSADNEIASDPTGKTSFDIELS